MRLLRTIFTEPVLRRLAQAMLMVTPGAWRAKARWDAVSRPQYLVGTLYAADQARREGRDSAALIEFGVAEGYGLMEFEKYAAAVERETGVRLAIYGFDSGAGMPAGTGDFRDHPDVWQSGDYPMDEQALRRRLSPRTTLVVGDVGKTVLEQAIKEAIGFIAMDLDYYSSTAAALHIFDRNDVPRLRRVAMYFDDLNEHYNHAAAGELLAIAEFNRNHSGKDFIDEWRCRRKRLAFPDAEWIPGMYIAHDLVAISASKPTRKGVARMR